MGGRVVFIGGGAVVEVPFVVLEDGGFVGKIDCVSHDGGGKIGIGGGL